MDKKTIKKTSGILINVVLYAFLAVCVLSVFLTVFSERDSDGAAELFGSQMRIVTSSSMEESEYTDVSAYEIKDIPIRSMIFIELIPENELQATAWYRSLKVGDVLTFRYVYTTQITITHRIVSIEEKETGGFLISLSGDNKSTPDGQMYQTIDTSIPNNTNYVIGKVTGQSYIFGVIMSFLMKPISLVLIIILPCFLIILLEVVKIVRMFAADKRKQEHEKRLETEKELEELRRRLAAIEEAKNAPSADDTTPKESDLA